MADPSTPSKKDGIETSEVSSEDKSSPPVGSSETTGECLRAEDPLPLGSGTTTADVPVPDPEKVSPDLAGVMEYEEKDLDYDIENRAASEPMEEGEIAEQAKF